MNIKKNLWESTVTSRGIDADIFTAVSDNGDTLYPSTNGNVNFPKNLELINARLYHIHKQLTYWDLYKITTAVNSSTALESTVAALAPGEACIINTNTFSDGSNQFSRGDVIVKTIDNELVVVRSVNSGLYYPIKMSVNGGFYSLTYAFSTSAPNKEASPVNVGLDEKADLAPEITFSGLRAADSDGYIYGIFQTFSSANAMTFKQVTIDTNTPATPEDASDDQLVYPVIKFFMPVANDSFEEIVGDFKVETSGENWSVTPKFYKSILGSLYMQVK